MHLHLTAAFGFLLAFCAPAEAVVGDAPLAEQSGVARHLVLIAGSRGNFCTGTVISRGLVLTAAHCVPSGVDYKLVEFDALRQPLFRDVALVVTHPQFDLTAMLAHRVTADVALLKLAEPLPPNYVPAPIMRERRLAVPGQSFLLAGYGVSVPGNGRTSGVARTAVLVATGRPGSVQLRPGHQGGSCGARRVHRRFGSADI
jgi:Trypsin